MRSPHDDWNQPPHEYIAWKQQTLNRRASSPTGAKRPLCIAAVCFLGGVVCCIASVSIYQNNFQEGADSLWLFLMALGLWAAAAISAIVGFVIAVVNRR
jgi:hypothetical protein